MPNPSIYSETHHLDSPLLYGGSDPYHPEFGEAGGPLEHAGMHLGSMNPAAQAKGEFMVTDTGGPSSERIIVQKYNEPYGGDVEGSGPILHPGTGAKPVGGEYHMTAGGKYMATPYDAAQAKREGYSEIAPVDPDWNAPLGKETPFEREQRIKTSGL